MRLEVDHVIPAARGGPATTANLRLRCRAHNQHEADRVFGKGFMDEKRQAGRARSPA
jgi:5-methylcytosine-specific restriction endonuclease McrA